MTNKLVHSDLIFFGQALGYKLSSGICHGFAYMLIQAWLADDEKSLFARLRFLENYKDPISENLDSTRLKADIARARRGAKIVNLANMDEKTVQLLEIPAFYEGVELYLMPDEYPEIFGLNAVQQIDFEWIYPKIRSETLEQEPLPTIFEKHYSFDRTTLKAYLKDLKQFLNKANEPTALALTASNHTVCLRYNKQSSSWHFVDINDFGHYADRAYLRELTIDSLVKSIFRSFFCKKFEYTVFHTRVIGKAGQQIRLSKAWETFDQKYPVRLSQANALDSRGISLFHQLCFYGEISQVLALLEQDKNYSRFLTLVGLSHLKMEKPTHNGISPLHLACEAGHASLVRLLLQLPIKSINLCDSLGQTPLHFASTSGRIEVINELMLRDDLEINKANKMGLTALHFACLRGKQAVVRKLLQHERIKVNLLNKEENTVLQCACYSEFTKGKPQIFELLLEHGADLEYQNEDGTALDLALSENHKTAIEVILNFANSHQLEFSLIASKNSLLKLGMVTVKSSSLSKSQQNNKDRNTSARKNSSQGHNHRLIPSFFNSQPRIDFGSDNLAYLTQTGLYP